MKAGPVDTACLYPVPCNLVLLRAKGIALDVAFDVLEQYRDLAFVVVVQRVRACRRSLDRRGKDSAPLEDIAHEWMGLADDQREQAAVQFARAGLVAGPPAFHDLGKQ